MMFDTKAQSALAARSSWLLSPITRRTETLSLAGLFVFFAVIYHLMPLVGDDWAWGSDIGIERLESGFVDYNGRYAGNLFVLGLSRAPILMPIVLSLVTTCIFFLGLHLGRVRTVLGYVALSVLYVAMPIAMWRQSVGWLSGFANYVTATLALLVFLTVARDVLIKGRQLSLSPLRSVVVVITAFISALFVEHVTLVLVGVTGLAFLYSMTKVRAATPLFALWFASTCTGAVVMFSNGAYWSAARAENTYQQIGSDDPPLVAAVRALDNVLAPSIVANATTLVATAGMSVVLLSGVRALKSKSYESAVVWFLSLFITGILAAATLLDSIQLNGVAQLGFLTALLALGSIFIAKDRRVDFVSLVFVGAMLMLPLLVVTPIGPRNLYSTYILVAIAAVILVHEAVAAIPRVTSVFIFALFGILLIFRGVSLINIYVDLSSADRERLDVATEQIESGEVVILLPSMPFSEYLHVADPFDSPWDYRYLLFNGLPTDRLLKPADSESLATDS